MAVSKGKATKVGKNRNSVEKAAKAKKSINSLTAEGLVAALKKFQSKDELQKIRRYFKSGKGEYGEGDQFLGVKMGKVFDLAAKYSEMSIIEIGKLLSSPLHEIRAAGVSIMDKEGRSNKTSDERRKEMYDLYLKRTDAVNNWDLVDLGSPYIVGRYLFDKPRTVLHKLARSKSIWERRIAIVSTAYFLRRGETSETFRVAELLVQDKEDLIHKAVGGWIREAGKKYPEKLEAFLNIHAPDMPRTMLRIACEKLDKKQKDFYLRINEGD